MNRSLKLLAGALLLASPAAAAQTSSPEDELERALEGRVAESPVQCITLSRVRSSTVIDGTAILYRTGSAIYVNRPRAGAERLDRDDTLVTRTSTARVCRGDPVRTRDPYTGAFRGAIILGEFVPYRRAG